MKNKARVVQTQKISFSINFLNADKNWLNFKIKFRKVTEIFKNWNNKFQYLVDNKKD